jgi:hypothetical protein
MDPRIHGGGKINFCGEIAKIGIGTPCNERD